MGGGGGGVSWVLGTSVVVMKEGAGFTQID